MFFQNQIRILSFLTLMLAIPVLAQDLTPADSSAFELKVFKSPSCGCCKKWISHIEESGFVVSAQDVQNLGDIKGQLGIQPQYQSCHTAVGQLGYLFEGHVPAKLIQQFLSESHADAIGLAVPGMPVGSPGMEVNGQFRPYDVLLLAKDGTRRVYARINSYEEQF